MKEFKILNYHQRLELFTTYWIVSKHYEYTTMLWKCGYFKLDTTTMAKIQMLITKIHIRLFRTTERSKFNEPSLYVLLYLSKIVLLPMYNAISYLIGHNYARSWPPWSFLKKCEKFWQPWLLGNMKYLLFLLLLWVPRPKYQATVTILQVLSDLTYFSCINWHIYT